MESKHDSENNKKCDISEIMESFKKYEIVQYFCICLPLVFISMISINYVFLVGEVGYRCRVDECEDANSTAQLPSWWPDRSIDKCASPVLTGEGEICTNNSFTGELAKCEHWIYESERTVVAELNLACQPWKTNLVGTIHSVGMFVSMIVFGWITDKYGRRPSIIFSGVASSVGLMKTFTTSYYMYIVVELLEAIASAGIYSASMILLTEIAGQKYRLLSGITCAYAIYIGEFFIAFLAMYVSYWKHFVYIIYGPSILFILNIFFIKESPRWQIVTGKIEDVKKLLKNIADTNKIVINNEELLNINETDLKAKFNIKKNEVKEHMIQALRSKEIMKRLLVAIVGRFATTFVYSGLLINSVWLPGDKYVNFILSTLMAFPGELLALYLMNKIGRKIPLIYGFSVSGVLCIISALIPTRYAWVKIAFILTSKMVVSCCFTGIIIYSMELYPTSVRGSLLGFTSLSSRMGSMLAPLTPILSTVWEGLPFVIFGCCSIVSSLLLCLTPETKDLPLFDTILQVENYSKSKS